MNLLARIDEHIAAMSMLRPIADEIENAGRIIAMGLEYGHRLLICGNGGSAAQAIHMAAELTGRFQTERRPLAAIALSADVAAITAIGNDFGFTSIFERQVIAIGRRHDILLAISTSGESPNVIRAIYAANEIGMTTIGLLGMNSRSSAAKRCHHVIRAFHGRTAVVQEVHAFICHAICEQVDELLSEQVGGGDARGSETTDDNAGGAVRDRDGLA